MSSPRSATTPTRRSLQEVQPTRPNEGLRPVAHAQLAVDVCDVSFDRRRADEQLFGNLLIPQPGRDQTQDCELARRQQLRRIRHRSRAGSWGGMRRLIEPGQDAAEGVTRDSTSSRLKQDLAHWVAFVDEDPEIALG